MADFRKWFLAFSVVALLLGLGVAAHGGPIVIITEEPVQVLDLAKLSGDFTMLCGIPLGAPGTQVPKCVLMRSLVHDPAFANGVVQLADRSDGNRVALGTRWQRPLVTLRV